MNAIKNGSNGAHSPSQNVSNQDAARVRTVSICDTQPVTMEGVRTLLSNCADLKFLETAESMNQAVEMVRRNPPDVLILDKAFGIQAVLDWLQGAAVYGRGIPRESPRRA